MSSNKPQKTAVSLVEITASQLNQRLDNFLLKRLGGVPRTRIYRIIRKGEVRVNKKRSKPDYKLQIGDQVRIPPLRIEAETRDKSRPPLPVIEKLKAAIVFENEHILVIDKPSGIAVHAGSGIDYGVIDAMRLLYPHTDIELVHRLDRDTSGCLLLAKHRQALLAMQAALQDNSLGKNYRAIVRGRWPAERVAVDLPLRKFHLPNGERRVTVDAGGKAASSRVKLLQAGKLFSLIQVQLVTGRTHQIRVHCQSQGHEIGGDEKYGDETFNRRLRSQNIKRLMLHASSLELPASNYSPEQVVNAPLPIEFEQLLGSD